MGSSTAQQESGSFRKITGCAPQIARELRLVKQAIDYAQREMRCQRDNSLRKQYQISVRVPSTQNVMKNLYWSNAEPCLAHAKRAVAKHRHP